jgi:hypothetical protein
MMASKAKSTSTSKRRKIPAAALRRRARAELAPPPVAAVAIHVIDPMTVLAARSKIAKYGRNDDGCKPPLAYIEAMAPVPEGQA